MVKSSGHQYFEHYISYDAFQDLMLDFANAVTDGKFSKVKYATWRELQKLPFNEGFIVRWRHNDSFNGVTIHLETENSCDGPWVFITGDYSFGDFIYKTMLKGVENSMGPDSCGFDYYDVSSSQKSKWYNSINSATSAYYDVSDELAIKADAADVAELNTTVSKLCESATLAAPMKTNNNTNNKKENFAMKFNFDFGPVNSSLVRMSLYGLAVKNKAGTWVSYDAKNSEIMDVDVLNFDGAKFLYKMPVAIKDIAIGDVIIHNGIPMFVVAIDANGKVLTAVDPINGERKDVMLARSPFGFNFATKVINFLGNLNTGANADNPFGNMWMLMMMDSDAKGDMGDILPFLMMNNATGTMDSNTLMFMALSHINGGSKDLLPLMLMMNPERAVSPAPKTCNCGGACSENHTQG